jgi:hypothetical protein
MTEDNGHDGPDRQERLAVLEETVAVLREELASLRALVAANEVPPVVTAPGERVVPAGSRPGSAVSDPPGRTTRRALLGAAGALGAGTAAGLLAGGAAATPVAALPGGPTVAGSPGWARYTGAGPGPGFLFEAGTGTTELDNPAEKAALAGCATGGAGFAPTTGVYGYSAGAGGIGVMAVAAAADGVGLVAQSGGGAALRVASGMGAPTVVPPATQQIWVAGDLLRSADGHLWYCTDGGQGSASRWSRLSGTGFELLAVPARAYDSRLEDGPFSGDETRIISLAAAIPARANGVLLNLTVADTVGFGYLQVYSAAVASPPATSNLNWFARGQILANAAVSAVDGSRQIKLTTQGDSASVIVDVFGYYA